MKKKCLFLVLAIGAVSANVRAQKTVTDYDGLKTAVGKVNSIPALNDTVTKRKAAVTAAEEGVTAAQRAVTDKEIAVDEKKAAVAPFQKVLAEKHEVTVAREKDVERAESVLDGLNANPQYPTSGSSSSQEDSPIRKAMDEFVAAVGDAGSGDITLEKAKNIKVYYRVQYSSKTGYGIYVTTATLATHPSQENRWTPVDASIGFEDEAGGTDFYIQYQGADIKVDEDDPLTVYLSYCDLQSDGKNPVVEENGSIAEKKLTGSTYEPSSPKKRLFSKCVTSLGQIAPNLPKVTVLTPIPNENYQTWLDKVQAAKDDLGYKDETTGEWVVGGKSKLLEDAQKDEAIAQQAVTAAEADVTKAEAAVIEARKAVLTADSLVTTAKGEVTVAEAAVTEAGTYKTLTISGDNEFVVTETLATEWPADGVIRGNGNKIVNDANTPLFTHNYGSISGLIAPNGRIASYNESGAQTRDCIVKVTSNEYRAYDDNGVASKYTKLDDAVYSMREYFGYDAATATATGKVTSDTKLYKAQNKVASNEPMTDSYVNITSAGKVLYAGSVSTENTVLYLDDTAVKSDNKDITASNVAVLQREVTDAQTGAVTKEYSCKKLELVDGSSRKEFYMPYSVTAAELSYSRTTTTNKVPVCMPFLLGDEVKKLIAENVGTDVSNVFFYTLNKVEDGVVWFTPQSSIGANKPGLIAFKDDVKLDGKKNLFAGLTTSKVEATPDIASLSAAPLNGGDEGLFGNYKPGQVSSVLVQAHAGAGNAAYCYQGGKLVRMKEDADGSTKLNQFRSYVIMKEPAATPNSLPDSFEIGFVDEDGNEVTGIGSVESGKSDNGFKAVGGNGVIAISADKACEVKVYTAGGSLVKAVRVEAGRTTLPFSAGMYIVNQTKVVVK